MTMRDSRIETIVRRATRQDAEQTELAQAHLRERDITTLEGLFALWAVEDREREVRRFWQRAALGKIQTEQAERVGG